MLRRLFAFLVLLSMGTLDAQAATRPFPSLARRPAELRDSEQPAQTQPAPIVPAAPDPQLAQTVATLNQSADQGDAAFRAKLDSGRAAVSAAAGAAPVSEAWVQAELAVSALDAARYDSVTALATLDTLHVDRLNGTDSARVTADMATIDPARARVLAMVDAQNDALDGLRASLPLP